MTGKNGSKGNAHQEAPQSPPRFTWRNKAPPIPSQGLSGQHGASGSPSPKALPVPFAQQRSQGPRL